MKTTYKQVPIEEPLQETTKRVSHSRSRQQRRTEVHEVEETSLEPTHIDDMETHVFVEDDLHQIASEELQPQTLVPSDSPHL